MSKGVRMHGKVTSERLTSAVDPKKGGKTYHVGEEHLYHGKKVKITAIYNFKEARVGGRKGKFIDFTDHLGNKVTKTASTFYRGV